MGLTPYLEIGGDYREIVPGVFLVELPLPFSLGLINVYLWRLDEGYLLVDCGMETEACLRALARAREGLGLAWSDIRHILLTHIHPDHMGLAPKLRDLTGAQLHVHAADLELLEHITQTDSYNAWQRDFLTAAGVPDSLIALISGSLADVHRSFHRLSPDRLLQGGETFAAPAGGIEVVWTPGHSPGHVCLYEFARRLLLSGDHILEHISPNIGWHPGRDALGEYLASLDLVGEREVDLLLPSHGSPFTGHRAWVRRTHAHHAARCHRIVQALDGRPQTANDLVAALWERDLSPFHYRFAIFEVMAHLEYLRRRGAVLEDVRDGVAWWRRPPASVSSGTGSPGSRNV
ncbi:MAG TPA: MBL fold metallo-hydrolase [Bryobacteraceae bacterium]|nr:MBL fold metallo-hydrolase [Bryobacteraceae bacterium]